MTKNTAESLSSPSPLLFPVPDFKNAHCCCPDQMVTHLHDTLKAHHPPTAYHCERVGKLAGRIARELGFPDEEVLEIETAGLLHDVGKIYVPRDILDKRGALTKEEYEEIKGHPLTGSKLLQAFPPLHNIRHSVECHHERTDGLGYPYGLQGEEIPIGARIIAVADAFDALNANRPYRRTARMEEALAEIQKHAIDQFDRQVVQAFASMLNQIPPYNSFTEAAAASYLRAAICHLSNIIPPDEIVATILYSNAVKPGPLWPRDFDLAIMTRSPISKEQAMLRSFYESDWIFDTHSIPPAVTGSHRLLFQKAGRPEVEGWIWPMEEYWAALEKNYGRDRSNSMPHDYQLTPVEIARLISQGVIIYAPNRNRLKNTPLSLMPIDNIMRM